MLLILGHGLSHLGWIGGGARPAWSVLIHHALPGIVGGQCPIKIPLILVPEVGQVGHPRVQILHGVKYILDAVMSCNQGH